MKTLTATPSKVALILLTVTAVFLPMLAHPQYLVWDDLAYLDWHVRGSSFIHRPLLKAYLNLVFPFFRFDGRPYLAVNFLLHGLNALLLFFLIRRLTARENVALIAALIFSLHDVNAAVTLRVLYACELFATGFSLGSLLLFAHFKENAGRRRRTLYVMSLGAFLCALLSRLTALGLPLVILAYDSVWQKPGERKRLLLVHSLPFFLFALVFALVSLQHPMADDAPFKLAELFSDPGHIITKFPRALLHLFFLHPFPGMSGRFVWGNARAIFIALFFLLCLFVLTFRPRSRGLHFGVGWVFLSVLSSALMSGATFDAKYFYFSLAATGFLSAWAIVACAERLGGPRGVRSTLLTAAFACSLLIPLAISIQDRQITRTEWGTRVQRKVDFVLRHLETRYSRSVIAYALDFPADIRWRLVRAEQPDRGDKRLLFVYSSRDAWPEAAATYALTMPGAPSLAASPYNDEGFYFLDKRAADLIPANTSNELFPEARPRAVFVFRDSEMLDLTQKYLPVTETTFRLRARAAKSVRLIGDLNDWKGHPLSRRPRGYWETTLRLSPNTYHYQFLVDDAPAIPDPKNPHRSRVTGRGECSLRAVINPALPTGLLPTGNRTQDRQIIRCKERVALDPHSPTPHLALAVLYRHYGFPREAELEEEMAQRLQQTPLLRRPPGPQKLHK